MSSVDTLLLSMSSAMEFLLNLLQEEKNKVHKITSELKEAKEAIN